MKRTGNSVPLVYKSTLRFCNREILEERSIKVGHGLLDGMHTQKLKNIKNSSSVEHYRTTVLDTRPKKETPILRSW